MERFADVLDRLTTTPARNGKLALLVEYFRAAPDPDRGYALGALTDGLFASLPLRRALGELMAIRIDPVSTEPPWSMKIQPMAAAPRPK